MQMMGRSFRNLPSPWLDLATAAMPAGHRDALAWSEYIYMQHPTFREAQERRISYFLTDIEINAVDTDRTSLGDDDRESRLQILREDMNTLDAIRGLNRDVAAYGNGFISLYEPFTRLLSCRKCRTQYKLEEVWRNSTFAFAFSECKFHMTCPKCDTRGEAKVIDIPEKDPAKCKLHLWSPKEIEIASDLISGESTYYWRIPQDYRQKLMKGSLNELRGANMELISAVAENCKLFEFAPGVIFHQKEPTLSGIRNNGWGISRVFANYREIWFTQLLRCQIESFAVDFVTPLRIICPDVRTGGGGMSGGRSTDPFMSSNMGMNVAQMSSMFRNKRLDPATWNFVPFPMRSMLLGGDAAQLIPHELYDQATESLLNATGTPVELYRGTLRLETAMVGLRLFEANNYSLVHANNAFLRWLAKRLEARFNWDAMRLSMKRVTYADDFNVSMMMAQLMMQQQISKDTFFKTLGVDARSESRQVTEETQNEMRQQEKMQREMEQTAFGQQISNGQVAGAPGGMPPGGAPPGGAPGAPPQDPNQAAAGGVGAVPAMDPNIPVSPIEIQQQAQSLAQQLWQMPEAQKDSELRQLAQKNEVLHRATKDALEKLRNQARLAGGEMMKQQQGGGMG
jgi:hypothetical protein